MYQIIATRSVVCALAGLVVCLEVNAADKDFINGSGGPFTNGLNWSPTGTPGAADRTVFNLNDAGYTITFSINPVNDRLRVSKDIVTLDLNAHSYTLTSTGSTSISLGGSVAIPPTGLVNGQLTVIDGTLHGESANLGTANFGIGTFNIGTGGFLVLDGVMTLGGGIGGIGSFNISNGGLANTFLTTIGADGGNSSASVSGAGSYWTSGSLDIAGSANGTLTISNGGTVVSESSVIAAAAGVTGAINLSSGGDFFCTDGDFFLGLGGAATMSLAGGSTVDTADSGLVSHMAENSGSSAIVTIDGAFTEWEATNLRVGNMGAASIVISNGGKLETFNNCEIGYHPLGSGSVDINGMNSRWMGIGDVFVGGGAGGPGGAGTLTVANAGEFIRTSFFDDLIIRNTGALNLDGGFVQVSQLFIDSGGEFNWNAGTLRLIGSLLLVQQNSLLGSPLTLDGDRHLDVAGMTVGDSSPGDLDVIGPATVVAKPDVIVGRATTGELTVSAGATLNSTQHVRIGDQPNGVGHVTLTGANTRWDHFALPDPFATEFNIGSHGVGELSVLDGALLGIAGQCVPSVARFAGSQGTLTIANTGRVISVEHGLYVGEGGEGHVEVLNGGWLQVSAIFIGSAGEGTVTAQSALVTSENVVVGGFGSGLLTIGGGANVAAGNCTIAESTGSTGDVTVDGQGSSLTATGDPGYLIVGGSEEASLVISNGAIVHAKEMFIGDGDSGIGNVVLSGAGTVLYVDEEISVGFFGQGTLEIGEHTSVVSPLVFVGDGDVVRGGGTLGDGAMELVIENAGRVEPGSSIGTMAIDGSFVQHAGGTLAIDIAEFDHDVLDVSGAVQLGGTLEIAFEKGFEPQTGVCFEIINSEAGQITGQFAQVSPRGVYEINYAAANVSICVAGGPTCPADIAPPLGNGMVDVDDLLLVINSWNDTGDIAADITGNQVVDVDDLLAVINAYGECE